jgi:RNA-directed DNA polymerase
MQMTVFTDAQALMRTDAAPTHDELWNTIEWTAVNQEVRKLQARIAKATREGKWRKVKALQWLLTHSYSAKCLAVRRVTENLGKRTPGVDGETWSTPAAKSEAITRMKRRGYQPKPLRRIYIPKSNGKKRPLGIPTMKDRAMQALHMLALNPVAETTADWNSYGFRPERCTADALGQLFVALAQPGAAEWVLEGDIKGCFDNISHEWMLQHICTDTKVLEKWLAAGFVEDGKLFPTNEGTPQGGIISPVLANLVLDGLEDLLGSFYGSSKLDGHYSRVLKHGVHFVRYADDFVITCHSKETLEDEIKPLVTEFLAERGLTLSQEKTKVTHISEGFDFLGQNVRKYRFGKTNCKLLITPSKKNVKAFLGKVRETIRTMRTAKQSELVSSLSPMVTGWCNFHRHVVAKETFNYVDHQIWQALWRWAKRRHPMKNGNWISRRYWKSKDDRNWVFSTTEKREGKPNKEWTLRKAADVAIQRHVKIQGSANPFGAEFEGYFEARLSVKMEHNLAGRRKLLYLWRRQDGKCPCCNEAITKITRWHVHHMIRRVDGGADTSDNTVLLHPACHRQGQPLSHVQGCRRPLRWRLLPDVRFGGNQIPGEKSVGQFQASNLPTLQQQRYALLVDKGKALEVQGLWQAFQCDV